MKTVRQHALIYAASLVSVFALGAVRAEIPTVDLSSDTARQVVIAQGTAEIYQGHPTTTLLPDGKTMFCVWTLGHGGTCGPMKRSDDGGKTWSDLLPVPENWKETRNCPSLYRLTDPQGVTRLFVFAGSGPGGAMQQAHSTDEGRTWTPMTSNGQSCVMPFCTIVPIDGGKRLLAQTNIRRPGETKDKTSNIIAQSESADGGLTWTPARIVLDLGELKPCEPQIVRSPDGQQLLCLLRENRKHVALFMTSDDEGRTWSTTKPLPPGLHGDRHMARFAADGRLVVCFRDTGKESSTKTHFVAWVGRYEDIVAGRDGQYRIKLLHSYGGGDCGYPGLELLPDGTFVATTYIKYRPGPEKQSVVSTRFILAETDKLAKNPPPQAAIELRNLPLLFADDSGVAARAGLVRTVHAARTRSEPVLVAERPWEGSRVYIYGSVHFDEAMGRFSMWYIGHPDVDEKGEKPAVPGFRKGKGDVVLYATSQDGLRWERPELGLHSFQGSTANNIVFDMHSPSVLVDERETDPAKRYKMLGSLAGKYFAAVSPDGLKWRKFPDAKPILLSSDNISLAQDPATGDYLAFHRRPSEIAGRNVSLSRSHDFQTWSEPELVFAPDAEDDTWSKNPDERTEVNNLSVFPHAAGFIGLPTMFRVLGKNRKPSELGPGQSPTDGIIDVQLITSADGREWHRTHPRVNVIARGAPGRFDAGTILGVSSTLVNFGDETWVYYTALTTSHGAPVPPKRISIGRAEWRRDGFVSLDAGERGRVETKPLQLGAPALFVNANATVGELRVALLEADGSPIPGYSAADCEPLCADATRWPVRWQSHDGPPVDRPVRVVVEMKQTRLFSISSAGSAQSQKNIQ